MIETKSRLLFDVTGRFYPVVWAAALFLLSACAIRGVPPASAGAAAPLFADAASDVVRMEQDTNEGRFDALAAMLAERQIPFEVEPFTIEARKSEPRTQGRNIVVTIPGRAPEIVIGAHYDASRLPDGTLSRGAVDNAASAVVLVRVADTLWKTRVRTRIRIVFFDMEELGLLGSAQFVQAHRERPARAMVNLDVNAFGDTVVFGPRTASNEPLIHAVRHACATIAASCTEFANMPPSDDVSFHKGGLAAVSIATLPALQAHQLWLLLNAGKESGLQPGLTPEILKLIHTTADASSRVDSNAMVRAYRLVVALVGRLDGA
jgi:Zn-dependent M28 family amino/carboxypeptidase